MNQDLTHLTVGASGKVVSLSGGFAGLKKLQAMGIVPGSHIVKKSASIFRGPVVVQKGAMQVAIGFGLAKQVIVEPDENKPSRSRH